ncbi:MAG: T9SS type A sorting domain-containing protein [Flavobacterium sp.]|nr:MAG: T9SS type A sorting domain-containing protein [Flavobacterium sp.]
MKSLIGLFVLLGTSYCFSQSIAWETSFGGKQADYLFDMQPTADYGFIIAGSSLSIKSGNKNDKNNGGLDYLLWKLDESGDAEWQKTFGGNGNDLLQSVKITRDGGFILAGTSDSKAGGDKTAESRGGQDFWIIKLDANGGQQWQKTIGGNGQDEMSNICETPGGGFILGGSSTSTISGEKNENCRGNLDYWIVKLDPKGQIEWQKTYGGQFNDILKAVEPTADGGYIVGGYSNSPDSGDKTEKCFGAGDFWVLKLDKAGATTWQRTIGGANDDELATIKPTADGGFIVGGNSNSGSSFKKTVSNGNGTDFWVLKLDFEGNISWQETYDFGRVDILTAIIENNDKSFLIGGFAQSEARAGKKDEMGITDFIALKISDTGVPQWNKAVGTAGDDILKRLIQTRDGGYVLAGTSNPTRRRGTSLKESKNAPALSNLEHKDTSISKNLLNQTDQISNQVTQRRKEGEKYVAEKTDMVNEGMNDGLQQIDPRLSGRLTAPTLGGSQGSVGKRADALDSAMSGLNKLDSPSSGDKTKNYGSYDFWLVKLHDKEKKKALRQNVEAIPNPASAYTNVIVGYEFNKGTATLYDIGGRVIQSFAIESRTVPINLSGLPEGIYIVQIATNKSTDSVKLIHGNSQDSK